MGTIVMSCIVQPDYAFGKFTMTDLISIVNLIVMVWIALGIQKAQTRDRFLREYFITEAKSIHNEYQTFFQKIINGEMSANDIKNYLKIMGTRITSLENYLSSLYKIEQDEIKKSHAEFQQDITDIEEYNNQYRAKSVIFTSESKNRILAQRQKINDCITKRIIEINSAHKRFGKYDIKITKRV